MPRLTLIIIFLSSVVVRVSFAQSEIAPAITELINAKDYAGAEAKLKEFGKQYPKSADVPMMKGNLEFRKYADDVPDIALNGNSNESIFESQMGTMEEAPLIIPDSVANVVARYWHSALALEPGRMDIHMGLCSIYSMALMERDVERELSLLRKFPGGDTIDPYTLSDFAKNMIARDDLPDGVQLYRYLAAQYPHEASGLFSDVAAQYQEADSLDLAIRYLDSALALGNPDAFVLGNALQFHTWNLQLDRAMSDVHALASIEHNHRDLFFSALMDYLHGDTKWRAGMKNYIKLSADSEQEERTLAGVLLDTTDDRQANLDAIDSAEHALYAILLAERGIQMYPKDRVFVYVFGSAEAECGNYGIAVQAIENGVRRNATGPEDTLSRFELLRAWVLQRTGRTGEALPLWNALITSKNNYASAAGSYFAAKDLIGLHQNEEANKILDVAIRGEQNKYVQMCKSLRKQSAPPRQKSK